MPATTRFPAEQLGWQVVESTNVEAIAYLDSIGMFVRYKHGGIYLYTRVTHQRFLAVERAPSVGQYLHRIVKPNYRAFKVA